MQKLPNNNYYPISLTELSDNENCLTPRSIQIKTKSFSSIKKEEAIFSHRTITNSKISSKIKSLIKKEFKNPFSSEKIKMPESEKETPDLSEGSQEAKNSPKSEEKLKIKTPKKIKKTRCYNPQKLGTFDLSVEKDHPSQSFVLSFSKEISKRDLSLNSNQFDTIIDCLKGIEEGKVKGLYGNFELNTDNKQDGGKGIRKYDDYSGEFLLLKKHSKTLGEFCDWE